MTEYLYSRRRGGRLRSELRAARWLLVGLVMAGLFGMHVLSEHDPAGGHGMVMGAMQDGSAADHAATSGPANDMTEIRLDSAMPAMGQAMPAMGQMSTLPGSPGAHMSMAACILFLVVGASVVLLSYLLGRRADSFGVLRWWGWSRRSGRAPPGSAPPRGALCVLRV